VHACISFLNGQFGLLTLPLIHGHFLGKEEIKKLATLIYKDS
jgi:hypothetical protein